VECSFEKALVRAIKRCQEGLPPKETIRAFETIYFPAQRIHLQRDHPRAAADLILPNDGEEKGAPTPKEKAAGIS
jgi:uridine kinase